VLLRGQTIRRKLDYVMIPMKAGQVSLHYSHIMHCSDPNRSDQEGARAVAVLEPWRRLGHVKT